MLACQENHAKVIKMLINKYGADVDAMDKNGNTALMMAAVLGHPKVAGLLIVGNANLEIKDITGQLGTQH